MRLHRYIAKITRPGSGETEFEVLGTAIGFFGMLAFLLTIMVSYSHRESTIIATIAIGSIYLLYWIATQIHRLLFFFQFIVVSITVTLFWIIDSDPLKNCSPSKDVLKFTRCESDYFSVIIWIIYFLLISIICSYYCIKLWRRSA